MNNQKKIRSAVIGLGVGAHQARTLSKHKSSELIWLCDFNKNKLADLSSELLGVKLTQNPEDVLSDPNIDLICIASYDESHFDQVIKALDNGKHVYVEKPICLSKNEAIDIRKKLKKNPHLRLSSNMVLRTCPLFKKVREKINSNTLGSIYYLEADYFWGRKEKLISGWRAEADVYSIIHGAAVHMIDLIIWLTGKKPLRAQALGNQITTTGTLQKNNDFALLLLEFENKMSVKISAHGGCVHPHFHSLKVFGSKSTFIHETTGTIWIDTSDPKEKLKPESADYPSKTTRDGALISFLDSIINLHKNALISDEEVFDTMSVCLAADKAVKTKQIVDIEYL